MCQYFREKLSLRVSSLPESKVKPSRLIVTMPAHLPQNTNDGMRQKSLQMMLETCSRMTVGLSKGMSYLTVSMLPWGPPVRTALQIPDSITASSTKPINT